MFTFSRKDGVHYLESLRLREYEFVTHAFCSRWGGVSAGCFADFNFGRREGDTDENVRKNWDILSHVFNIPAHRFFTVKQVHEDRILVIDDDSSNLPKSGVCACDGIITTRRGIAIGVKTADCVPIFILDRVKGVVGVIHAGWKGTSLNIAGKAIAIFKNRFACRVEDLLIVIGPAIGSCCYEVDEVVYAAMGEQDEWTSCAKHSPREGRWMLDLAKFNALQIHSSDIPQENISVSRICTSCRNDVFFSHRAEGGCTGRQVSFIMLRSDPRENTDAELFERKEAKYP